MKKIAVIAGAGPRAHGRIRLLSVPTCQPLRVESDTQVDGISKTINYRGNRMAWAATGFSRNPTGVMNWWQAMLPVASDPETGGAPVKPHIQGQERDFTADSQPAAVPPRRGLKKTIRK